MNAEVVRWRDSALALLGDLRQAPVAPLQPATQPLHRRSGDRAAHDADARNPRLDGIGTCAPQWQRPADTIADLGSSCASRGSFRSDALRGHHDSWGAPLLTSPAVSSRVERAIIDEAVAWVPSARFSPTLEGVFTLALVNLHPPGPRRADDPPVSPGFGTRDKCSASASGRAHRR